MLGVEHTGTGHSGFCHTAPSTAAASPSARPSGISDLKTNRFVTLFFFFFPQRFIIINIITIIIFFCRAIYSTTASERLGVCDLGKKNNSEEQYPAEEQHS